MSITKKLSGIKLKDIDRINWRPSRNGLWNKQDDIDLIKICRSFKNNDLHYYLKKRFPNRTLKQCKMRYDNSYAPHIKKYRLNEDDKQYIIKKMTTYDINHMAYNLGVSYYLVRNFVGNERRIEYAMKSVNRIKHQKLSEIPTIKKLSEVPITEKLSKVPITEKLSEVPIIENLSEVPIIENLSEVFVATNLSEISITINSSEIITPSNDRIGIGTEAPVPLDSYYDISIEITKKIIIEFDSDSELDIDLNEQIK
jgi:hypothetical protein